MTVLAFIVAGSLLVITGLHVYWALGGRWGGEAALPRKADGTLLFKPGVAGCFVVALGLAATAGVCAVRFTLRLPPVGLSVATWTFWVMTAVFALRVLGDFQYVGLFRKVRTTDFAAMDAKVYTPLCAGYALAFATLAMAA
ncbi:DUF3995 domain-containing protein [Verrucomicrobium sp. BvORR106]|uniref:DUF3995 domain-containing protein n=1 Tax=Verrucomicrobium sp. BvORR106 TaxID=1403819 RepID=UPI00056F9AEB|nr:DUF3995 domain-containing protein [Verrucomicrobium sp. BvORR106]